MKKIFLINIISSILISKNTFAQTIDTIINVGNGHQLHFNIIKGKGAPILFESGFGNGAEVWKNITKQIADVTSATIITYDRLSFGDNAHNYKIGFLFEIKALEVGLQKLGYANKNMMLVSHSLGGLYNSYYASRHPKEVKAAVLIDDANACSLAVSVSAKKSPKEDILEKYFANILDTVIQNPMPLHIPVLDIVAVDHTDENGNKDTVWINCHKSFVAQSPKRSILLAYGVGHYVFVDNPLLAINAIIKQYAIFLAPDQKNNIIEKGYALELAMINDIKKNEVKCGHSEDDLNTWGYSLLENKETEKAIEVFKLNSVLNPSSWNAYDSLAEAYLKASNKDLAIKNYKKSLELNSKNENATKVLEQLLK